MSNPTRWPQHRILFLLAGTMTLAGTLLAAAVSPWFLIIPALVGANQLLMASAGWCPVSLLLTRLVIPQGVPWDRQTARRNRP